MPEFEFESEKNDDHLMLVFALCDASGTVRLKHTLWLSCRAIPPKDHAGRIGGAQQMPCRCCRHAALFFIVLEVSAWLRYL